MRLGTSFICKRRVPSPQLPVAIFPYCRFTDVNSQVSEQIVEIALVSFIGLLDLFIRPAWNLSRERCSEH